VNRLYWNDLQLLDIDIPAGGIRRGEKQRLVMPQRYQFEWLKKMSTPDGCIRLRTKNGDVSCGSESFVKHVACVLHQRSALANLSLRENILLPFLYKKREPETSRAMQALPDIATRLEISDLLDEQAGERFSFMHGVISLGRAMLLQPDFIVVLDAHLGMQPPKRDFFRSLFCSFVEETGAGVLYLSTSVQDASGLKFCRSLELPTRETFAYHG
jgi:ABC-type transporter Mla maintaining outer membrane lipid asymmetry ATPase subunit MlaF